MWILIPHAARTTDAYPRNFELKMMKQHSLYIQQAKLSTYQALILFLIERYNILFQAHTPALIRRSQSVGRLLRAQPTGQISHLLGSSVNQ